MEKIRNMKEIKERLLGLEKLHRELRKFASDYFNERVPVDVQTTLVRIQDKIMDEERWATHLGKGVK